MDSKKKKTHRQRFASCLYTRALTKPVRSGATYSHYYRYRGETRGLISRPRLEKFESICLRTFDAKSWTAAAIANDRQILRRRTSIGP